MSDDTERRLHDQLFAVGTIDPPPGLADAALRQAKQRRHRGITAVATAAAVVLAIAIAVPLSVRHRSAAPAHPRPPQRNLIVSYTTGISNSNPGNILMVLDPKTGKYVESKLFENGHRLFGPQDLTTSPDGRNYATIDGRYVGTVADIIDGDVARLHTLNPGPTGGYAASWSADSTRLLIPNRGVIRNVALNGFRIYDVRTKKLGKLVRLSSNDVGDIVWATHDTEIMGLASHRLEFFDLNGKLQRTVTLPKHVEASKLLSPDGRFMSLDESLLDLRTGRSFPLQLPPGRPIPVPVPLGWVDDNHYVVDWRYSTGERIEERLLVLSNSGKLIKSITPPYGASTLPNTIENSSGVTFTLGYGADYRPHSGLRL